MRGGLLAGTVLAIAWAVPAAAQEAAEPQAIERSITVRAGSLTQALNSLAAQTGMQILFDASLTSGKTTRTECTPRSTVITQEPK